MRTRQEGGRLMTFDNHVELALAVACEELEMTRQELLRLIIREWPESYGFLPFHVSDEDGDIEESERLRRRSLLPVCLVPSTHESQGRIVCDAGFPSRQSPKFAAISYFQLIYRRRAACRRAIVKLDAGFETARRPGLRMRRLAAPGVAEKAFRQGRPRSLRRYRFRHPATAYATLDARARASPAVSLSLSFRNVPA